LRSLLLRCGDNWVCCVLDNTALFPVPLGPIRFALPLVLRVQRLALQFDVKLQVLHSGVAHFCKRVSLGGVPLIQLPPFLIRSQESLHVGERANAIAKILCVVKVEL
jgi:hypothetical protein